MSMHQAWSITSAKMTCLKIARRMIVTMESEKESLSLPCIDMKFIITPLKKCRNKPFRSYGSRHIITKI
jgi:hypothetical protein